MSSARVVRGEGLVERARAELRERRGVADRGAPDRDGATAAD